MDTENLIGLLISLRSHAYDKDKEKAMQTVPAADEALSRFPRYRFLFAEVLGEYKLLIYREKFAQAYDLIDAVHCLPELVNDENRNMSRYWKTHIAPYQEKYGTDFFDPYKQEILAL